MAAQIDRYSAMARRRDSLDTGELSALYTLVARRPDADLVFADAGRRAGRHAAKQTPGLMRAVHRTLPRGLRERLGRRLIRRAAARVFAVDMAYDSTSAAAVETCGARAIPGGRPWALYGSGLAELLRIFTSFDGAYFRIACRARGDATCRWFSVPTIWTDGCCSIFTASTRSSSGSWDMKEWRPGGSSSGSRTRVRRWRWHTASSCRGSRASPERYARTRRGRNSISSWGTW